MLIRSFQIVIYAILSPVLGKYVDTTIAGPGVHAALYNIAGVCIASSLCYTDL